MRFLIRDLLWATVILVIGLAWWVDNQTKHAAVQQAHRLHPNLGLARQWHSYYQNINLSGFMVTPTTQPDWAVLEEPLVGD